MPNLSGRDPRSKIKIEWIEIKDDIHMVLKIKI
jgi:hypothetical protein